MKNMTLENIEKACGGRYIGTEAEKKTEVLGVVIDSRQVESGYLFVAIPEKKSMGTSLSRMSLQKARQQFCRSSS